VKALTLIRPWAEFVIDGDKPIENRTWAPPESLLGERFAIHAGQGWDPKGVLWIRKLLGVGVADPDPADHHQGIVGTVRLIGWCSADGRLLQVYGGKFLAQLIGPAERAALFGPVGWILREPRALAKPVPCRGHQRLWNVPHHLLSQVAP
jgi:hypothetical protein